MFWPDHYRKTSHTHLIAIEFLTGDDLPFQRSTLQLQAEETAFVSHLATS